MMWNFNDHGNSIAIITTDGNEYSYSYLEQQGADIASKVGGRKLVLCLCSNQIGSLVGYAAFLHHGIVPMMLSAKIAPSLLNEIIETYRPDYIWHPSSNAKIGYVLEKTSFNQEYPLNENLALLMTTSGSTGSLKFVRQSYDNVRVNTSQIIEYLQIKQDQRPITTLPMNYTYGLSVINTHLMAGATLLLTDAGLMQRSFWDFFKSAKATSFAGVPYTYEMLDKLRFTQMNLPSLQYMTQAGGKLSTELHDRFAQYAHDEGKKFIVMYGQCEATARMAYLPWQDAIRKSGYMGIPIPGGRFELIDENDRIIPSPDSAGELIYYGANVAMGYADSGKDLALGDEKQGRLATGDIAVYDSEGYYKIVGRKKRFLKIYGNRVNLDEVDEILNKKFKEPGIVCSGKDDHMVIFVENTANRPSGEDIKHYVSGKLNLNSAAFEVVDIAAIPRNDSGKVLYDKLRFYYDF